MKTKIFPKWRCRLALAIFLLPSPFCGAQNLQLVSMLPDSSFAPAGGNGDSYLPVITPDGRYVLFASGADNLVLTNSNGSVPNTPLHNLNVFLRDRVSGTTTLVSVNLQGNGGNGNSFPSGISTNGQYALFESFASDLVSGDTNSANDIFVRDLIHNTTTLISVSTNGAGGNGNSRSSSITPDGRYVVFVSEANNLVAHDTNGIPDIFVRDLQSNTTTLASVGAISANLSYLVNGSESPEITPDGRYVAFDSTATNLVSGVQLSGEVYVRDLVGATTIWASTNSLNVFSNVFGTPNETSCHADISANGQFIAFETCTTNMTILNAQGIVQRFNLQTDTTDIINTNANAPLTSPLENINNLDITPNGRFIAYVANTTNSGGNTAIYLWDSQTGTNILVSADQTTGLPAAGNCDVPVVNSSGQFVAFISNATNLTANVLDATTNSLRDKYHLYLRNMIAGTTQLIDADTNSIGIKVDSQTVPIMSDDGSLIFFDRIDGSLVANDWNRDSDVFARNTTNGTTELISAHEPTQPSQLPAGFSTLFSTSVSTNGRYIAFSSDSANLAPNDTNGFRDVFLRDLWAGTNALVSIGTNGFTGTNVSSEPSISADGRYVAFSSAGVTLAPAAYVPTSQNIFVRDLQMGTTALITTNIYFPTPHSAGADSFTPTISSNGRYILFHSKAIPDNLTMDGFFTTGIENLFFHDQQLGTNYALTLATSGTGVTSATMTPDGHYVAFNGILSGSGPSGFYIWDSQSQQRIYTNTLGLTNYAISLDGHHLAYIINSPVQGLTIRDLVARTNISEFQYATYPSHPGPQFSADARFVVFAARNQDSGKYDIYLYDVQGGYISGDNPDTNLLVSWSYNSASGGNGNSDSPGISPDGRFIAYRSTAGNIVPASTNGVPELLLYDRLNRSTTLVSVNQAGNSNANNWSLMPVFSGDSSTLVFESYASDLSPGFNEYSAIYALKLLPAAIVDTDGDGMDDNWEMQYFGTLARDGTGDYDGDGASDLFEYLTGTEPTNPNSKFAATISGSLTAGQNPTINWPLAPGKSYRVQFKDNLSDTNWQDVNGSITLIGSQGRITDLTPKTGQRFYHIVQN